MYAKVDLNGEHYDKHPCMYVRVDLSGEHYDNHYVCMYVKVEGCLLWVGWIHVHVWKQLLLIWKLEL